MGRKPRICLENNGKVLALSEEGYLQREVARRVGCSQKSVSDILKKTVTYWLFLLRSFWIVIDPRQVIIYAQHALIE